MTLIDDIEKVRGSNNKLWMDILRLAMTHAPDKTREILRDININDQQISNLLGFLSEEPERSS
jgi:hypothetical protein